MAQLTKLGSHKTSVYVDNNGFTCVKYHDTKVVDFDDKSIRLDSGGWHTLTTKARMNQASNQFELGFKVFQKNFIWYITFKGETRRFYDGMVLFRD